MRTRVFERPHTLIWRKFDLRLSAIRLIIIIVKALLWEAPGGNMRIDKFLKLSRVIKRRTVAAEACDGGRIEIGGKPVKPSKEVKVGDVVTVTFGNRSMSFEVLSVDERQTKQSAESMYRVIE